MMNSFSTARENILPINDNYSGYNYCPETSVLGFKKEWNLGGDDGHGDFNKWLSGWFSYEHPDLCVCVYQSYLAAAIDPKRAYDKHVLYALDLFAKAESPGHYDPDSEEEQEQEDALTDLSFVAWCLENTDAVTDTDNALALKLDKGMDILVIRMV